MGNSKIEIEAKNLVICRYLGKEANEQGEYFLPQYQESGIRGDSFLPCQLKFHKNWSWIMPVVLKIAKDLQTYFYMEDPDYIASSTNHDKFMFSIAPDCIHSSYAFHENPIRATFEAIVTLIEKKRKFEAEKSPTR